MSRYFVRVLLTAVAACSILALSVASASAGRISVDDQDFEIRWASLEFVPPIGNVIRCPVTLLGSFHSATIRKVVGVLAGVIDHARVGDTSCANGRATILQETIPWHVRYRGFTGTLPLITSIGLGLIDASFRIQTSSGDTCLARTTVAEPGIGSGTVNAAGQITGLAASGSIDLAPSPSAICDFLGANGSFTGTGAVEDLAGGLLFIRLI